jgi:hypothetical protein
MVTTMLVQKTSLVLATAALVGPAQAVFVVAYDDTAEAAYSSGWAVSSNGGYGFGAWGFSGLSTNQLGNSNTNGALGGPGINVGGNSWQLQQGIGWSGAMAGRSIGNYSVADVFEIDADFGALSTGWQAVSVFDSAQTDFLQVRSNGTAGPMVIESIAGTVTTSVGYSDGGYRLGFAYTSSSTVNVSITTLATNTTLTYAIGYSGTAGQHFFSLGATDPVAGQELYANRMKMTSPVPEPASLTALALGLAAIARRRREI